MEGQIVEPAAAANSVKVPGKLRETLTPGVWVVGLAVFFFVAFGAWTAGERQARLQSEHSIAELSGTQNEVPALHLQIQELKAQLQSLKDPKLSNAEKANGEIESMRRQILRLQAELSNLQSVSDLDQRSLSTNDQVLSILTKPGVLLRPLRGSGNAIAYALIIDDRDLLVTVSSLPALSPDHEYQLWLHRKSDPKWVNAGIFTPDETGRATVQFSMGSLINEVREITITEEPAGGSETPSGDPILASESKDSSDAKDDE